MTFRAISLVIPLAAPLAVLLAVPLAAAAVLGLTLQAGAVPVERLVYKLTDTAGASSADADGTWLGAGGLNEGVAGATDLANNGVDYKDSWVDDNWAEVLSVRVAMYEADNLTPVAYLDFMPGTGRDDFFSKANLTGSTWGPDAGLAAPAFFFAIPGDVGNGRHWFVQHNYGGCGIDRGWMVVLEGGGDPCGWERVGKSALEGGTDRRGFLYSLVEDSFGNQNALGRETGVADLFTVTVTYDDGIAPIPVPASALLLAGGLGGLATLRRCRKTA